MRKIQSLEVGRWFKGEGGGERGFLVNKKEREFANERIKTNVFFFQNQQRVHIHVTTPLDQQARLALINIFLMAMQPITQKTLDQFEFRKHKLMINTRSTLNPFN